MNGTDCAACPPFSWSLNASMNITDCKCIYPYRGFNGDDCRIENYAWVDRSGLVGAPGMRASHATASIGNTLYLFGGEDGAIFTNDFASLELIADGQSSEMYWVDLNEVQNMPSPRTGHGLASAGGKLYLFGGDDTTDIRASLMRYTPGSGEWQSLGGLAGEPRGRKQFGMAEWNGTIFVGFGQGSGGVLRDLSKLDTSYEPPRWTGVPISGSWPSARFGCQMVTSGGRIYLFGGRGVANTDYPESLWQYSILGGYWSEYAGLGGPQPRMNFGMATLHGFQDVQKIILFGGERESQFAMDDLWELDVGGTPLWTINGNSTVPAWTNLDILTIEKPEGRRLLSMASPGSSIVVTGGIGTGQRYFDDARELQVCDPGP